MNHHTTEVELEKNELVEWADKKFGHLKPHVNKILLGLAMLLVLGFGFAYYQYLQRELYSEQWRQLNTALHNQMITGNTSEYTVLAETFPEANASMWALQLAGDTQLRQGLSRLISDRNAAIKELEKAKGSYERILESDAKLSPMLQKRALYSLAYTCETLGDFDTAKTLYTRLVNEVPDSAFAKQADRALERLANPAIRDVWTQFKTVGTAPGASLPTAPDISFPDLGSSLEGSGESADNKPAENKPAEGESASANSADVNSEQAAEEAGPAKSDGDGQ